MFFTRLSYFKKTIIMKFGRKSNQFDQSSLNNINKDANTTSFVINDHLMVTNNIERFEY